METGELGKLSIKNLTKILQTTTLHLMKWTISNFDVTQLTFTSSEATVETLGKGMEYVQS